MSENVANRTLKARAKAAADRIQQDIRNAKVIRNRAIHSNDLLHIAESDDLSINNLPSGNISVPLSFWLENKQAMLDRDGPVAVQIASNEMPEMLADDLPQIDIIVLPFVNFVDGRSYSHAHKLRLRYAYKGEIRAVGDVNFDQLDFLTRAGCDAFELRENADYETALRAFTEFSEVYQPAADDRRLIFSRRRKVH
ncbi:MAG: hypothetical protein ACI9WC_003421 [Arenicella sp.]|jgi:uncharacterized protein (DUF934 family)